MVNCKRTQQGHSREPKANSIWLIACKNTQQYHSRKPKANSIWLTVNVHSNVIDILCLLPQKMNSILCLLF